MRGSALDDLRELAIWHKLAPQPCIRSIRYGSVTMMQPCASVSEAPRWWHQSRSRHQAMGSLGSPPPRIVIDSSSRFTGQSAENL